MCTDGRIGKKVAKGASWWCAGHCVPFSISKLAPTVDCRFGTWSDFCLRHAQYSFTPHRSARERRAWLGFPLFSFHYAQTRMEPYFHITFSDNIWQKCINLVTFVSWIYVLWCEESFWHTSLNIGQMRAAENCPGASLNLCSISPEFELQWQTAALSLSGWLEVPLCTPDWLI